MKRLLILPLIFLVSCSADLKFDKDKWNEKSDIFYKYRRQMDDDLIKNHLNSKMSKREITDMLGESNDSDTTRNSELTFEIYEDYGWDIDPIETQNLIITLYSDSALDKVYLETWRCKLPHFSTI